MKRLAVAALLSLLIACPGKPDPKAVDQAAVDACFLTIGVTVPGRESKLGTPEGWFKAAQRAVQSEHAALRRSGGDLLAALDPTSVVKDGYTESEVKVYTDAVLVFERICKESGAFKKEPFK